MQKLTLIPRGQAKGLTWFVPGEDPTLISKQQIFARIVGALGGRATEEVIWGDMEITTGASSDLAQVSNMARQMVGPQPPSSSHWVVEPSRWWTHTGPPFLAKASSMSGNGRVSRISKVRSSTGT